MNKPRVIVLGGGNGTSRLLLSLLPLIETGQLESLYALVHMADDGGSTGRLRAQYGVAAVGDLTKCLLALSQLPGDIRGEELLQALEYRFTTGDFQGHTLRNIVLTALEKISDIDSAIATMARVLDIPKYSGVVPTTLTTLREQVEIIVDGKRSLLGEGEHFIAHHVNLQADPKWRAGQVRVTFAEGEVPLNPRAEELLQEASHIIIAPGHTFGTILPTLALPALSRAVALSPARLLTVMTLLTTPRQTTGWRGEDFVSVYQSYLGGKKIETVVANNDYSLATTFSPGQDWVRFESAGHSFQLREAALASTVRAQSQTADTVPRAIVVHDSTKLTALFRDILSL